MSPRRPKDLRRVIATKPERLTILVFCEGLASEPDYVNGLKRLPEIRANTAISIEIDPQVGQPLVERAVQRSRDDEIDECWCLFDVEWPDNHPNLAQARQRAEANGVRLAISNPCFEIWLALHFQDCTAATDTRNAERMSRKLDGRAGKRIDADRYMPLRYAAAERAAALARRHRGDGTPFPRDNPSSGMHEFLAAVDQPRTHP